MFDNAVANEVYTGLGSFRDDAFTAFNTVIPIAMAVLITITIVFLAIRWFTRMALGRRFEYLQSEGEHRTLSDDEVDFMDDYMDD